MALLCPRCRTDLQERPAHELLIYGCSRCGGVWLDRDGVARLGEALSGKTLAAVDAVASEASRQENEARPIDCPRCAEILIRTPVAAAGVAIDRCPDHGAFYDRNELQKVARALGSSPPVPPAPVMPPKPMPAVPPKPMPAVPPKPASAAPPKPVAPAPVPPRRGKSAGKKKSAPGAGAKTAPPKPAVAAPPESSASPKEKPSGGRDAAGPLLGVAEVIVEVALSFL